MLICVVFLQDAKSSAAGAVRATAARPGAKSTSTRRTESSHAKNRKGAAKKIDEIRLKSSWIAPKLCTAIRNEDKKLLLGDHCSI